MNEKHKAESRIYICTMRKKEYDAVVRKIMREIYNREYIYESKHYLILKNLMIKGYLSTKNVTNKGYNKYVTYI